MQQLTKKQFKKYCDIVHGQCGIKLTNEKWELLHARIGRRIRALRIEIGEYLSVIENDPVEMSNFVDAISTNHTFFFREVKSFEFLDASCRDIWCAASSSGEEPYSIAIYCKELGSEPSILATDISDSCLEKGREAIYPRKSVSAIPKQMLKRHFQDGQGKWEDHVRIKADIRRMVDFRKFNLLKDSPPSTTFDIIFCRNVMIYFDKPTKEAVVRRLCMSLRQGGHFIVGGAESFSGLDHSLKYIAPSVYRK